MSKLKKVVAYSPRKNWTNRKDLWLLGALGVAGVLMLLIGCAPMGYVKAEALKGPLDRLVERHDVYMDKDTTLSPLKRRVNKRDGALLQEAINTAVEKAEEEDVTKDDQTSLWISGLSVGTSCAVYHYPDGVCPGYPYGNNKENTDEEE